MFVPNRSAYASCYFFVWESIGPWMDVMGLIQPISKRLCFVLRTVHYYLSPWRARFFSVLDFVCFPPSTSTFTFSGELFTAFLFFVADGALPTFFIALVVETGVSYA